MNNTKIEKLVPGGQGIGIAEDGKKGFFWNALPGETVTKFTVAKNKSHYFEAIAEEIENHSTHRIAPKDTCFLSTSPWQIMDYDYELAQKSELLQEIFRQNEIAIDAPKVITDGQDFFYRNKMEYSLYWDNDENKIKLAQHARGSHHKVPLETSSIESPEIFKKAQEIVDDLNARHEEARKYQSLLLRCNQQGKVEGGLYENKKPHPVFNNLTDEILGQKYSYSPNGFFQINLPVYELALKEIAKFIETKNVLDLYSGVGTIGLSVARGKNLTLVECDKSAFRELEHNVAATGDAAGGTPTACRREPSTVGETAAAGPVAVLAKSEESLSYVMPNQTVILDPPRAGCAKKLLEKLLEVKPQRIIYLSCNPATQARDVKILLEKYQIADITPFNFFPRTPHLENLVILDKN